MKKLVFLLAGLLGASAAYAQPNVPAVPASTPAAAPDTARLAFSPGLVNPVSLQSYESFRVSVLPLVRQMAQKKVVALGESTHGTAEFNTLRFWLTRILLEEYGFAQVALENDYTDTYLLGEELHAPDANVIASMKRHLYSIWQNQEMATLLNWLRSYNQAPAHRPVQLRGIDAAYVLPEARELQALAARYPHAGLHDLTSQLLQVARTQDAMWESSNLPNYQLPYNDWMANGLRGYAATEQLEQALAAARLPRRQRERARGFLFDAKLAFSTFYEYKTHKRDVSRDSLMAAMTVSLIRGKSEKVIIWAHDGHVSRKTLDPTDNNGGGMGAYLEQLFPGQYFVLGTSTGTGTFAATTDHMPTRVNPIGSYPLEKPLPGSWEAALSGVQSPVFYLQTQQLGAQNRKRPLRFVGFGPESGKKTYEKFKLADAYDALLFVRQTTAVTPLR